MQHKQCRYELKEAGFGCIIFVVKNVFDKNS